MTDYQPLIARAVEALTKNSGEARRALYERARNALVTQLRAIEPTLPESDITKERLSLEEAIRKVEADAARKSRMEARTEPRFEPRPFKLQTRPAPAEPAPRAANPAAIAVHGEGHDAPAGEPPSAASAEQPYSTADAASSTARGRLLSARSPSLTQEALKDFRDVVHEVDDLGTATAKAAQSARNTRDSYDTVPLQRSSHAADPSAAHGRFDHQFDEDDSADHDFDSMSLRSLEPSYETEEEPSLFAQHGARPQPPRGSAVEDDYEETRPPRSYRGLIKPAAALVILAIVVAALSWVWPNITHFVAQLRSKPQIQTTQAPPVTQPKFPGRVPQEKSAGPGPAAGAPGSQTTPAVAQRVVLYEEDPSNPQGRRFVGSAIWRTETVSPGPGLAPELAVRADVEIPERRMTVTWSLRRNTDPALPASHTVEIMFNLPADFPGGGISNVPGILMKEAEQARGIPLAGLAVKVTTGFFLIGLSAVDADLQRNLQLLKDREWFDIPIVYTNGGRAILAMEKGPPGDRAFADAFAAWGK